MNELRRLIVRHRHVAPLVATVLAGTDAEITIRDADGTVLLDRGAPAGNQRFPITVDRDTLGFVEGGRTARAIAAVISYAAARERDKRSLALEALERYRELSLIYDLAGSIGASHDVDAIVDRAMAELARLPQARGFVLLDESMEPRAGNASAPDVAAVGVDASAGRGIVGAVLKTGVAELVEDPSTDPRATDAERGLGSIVAAPLRVEDRTVGVLGAVASSVGGFRAADLKVVTAIAVLIAPALVQAARHAAVPAAATTS